VLLLDMDDEQRIFEMYSQEEIENFRMIFIMFDPEKTGFVGIKDLETILGSLGRDPEEANDLVDGMQLADERLSFMEFLKIMKALESRLTAKDENTEDPEDELEPIEGTLEDRNKFGALLPRTGVHFLPDSKVVDFLR
jgi:Ca2+-binding EF-hand superfamily protein